MGNYKLKLAIMQPTFNPWLGYFDLIDYVDEFIFLDTVQLNQQSWQTRNKIKINNKEHLVSLPIKKSQKKHELLIKDTFIDISKFNFRIKLIKTLEQNYRKSLFYKEVHTFITELIFYNENNLSKYNINIIQEICKKLDISTKITILSNTQYQQKHSKNEQVLDICKYTQTNTYISPIGSEEYLSHSYSKFHESNIAIFYQNYTHPSYSQIGDSFLPYLGIFDLLYNVGFGRAKSIIQQGRNYTKKELL